MSEKRRDDTKVDLEALRRAAKAAAEKLNARGAQLLKSGKRAPAKTPKGSGKGWGRK